ncbi:uncharacterized protein LOC115631621 isoform X2 [Scaptodrosophila lebanonensis]|nr:uncharacterized protein LOC115631621 isoform X2 [Scaptodrosophila lebanonensis]
MENPQQPNNNCYCSLKDTKSQYDMDREFAGEAIVDMSRIFRDKLLLNDDAPFQASSTTSVRRSRSKTRKPSDRLRPSAESSSSPENRRREKSRKARKSRSVSAGTRASVVVPKRRAKSKSKSDPVALYQYYQKEWKHFRKQIPGELSHPGLRWQIRNKMLEPK